MKLRIAATWLVLVSLAPGQTTSGPTSEPGSLPSPLPGQYVDSLHGFTMTPPPETERIRESAGRRLVSWVKRDEKAGAIRWTLEVFQTVHEPTTMPVAEYAGIIADELTKAGQFKVESTSLPTVAGKPGMRFAGLATSPVTQWRVQTWIQADPRRNLVLSMSGPVTDKKQLETILDRAVASVELFDPAEVLEARREGLKRGAAVLEGLTLNRIGGLLAPQAAYFLIRAGGKTIGFLRVSESLATRDKVQGLSVVRVGALKPSNEPRRLTRDELFVASDRSVERWKRILQEGQEASGRSVQEAEKSGTLMRVRTTAGSQRPRIDQRDFPEAIRDAYLPLAMDILAPRLLDLTKPGNYGFAVYNSSANDFEMRNIRVIGSAEIVLEGRGVKAVHLTDQMSIDAPLVDEWVDSSGMLLRMSAPDGVVVQRTDRTTVVNGFAVELIEVDKLGS